LRRGAKKEGTTVVAGAPAGAASGVAGEPERPEAPSDSAGLDDRAAADAAGALEAGDEPSVAATTPTAAAGSRAAGRARRTKKPDALPAAAPDIADPAPSAELDTGS
jgi:hypothetical protein